MTPPRRSFAIMLVLAGSAVPAVAADPALRVGMIPDAGATQVSIEEKAPLRDYLEKVVGERVELIIPTYLDRYRRGGRSRAAAPAGPSSKA